jgi:hypothetical protein
MRSQLTIAYREAGEPAARNWSCFMDFPRPPISTATSSRL